MKNKFCMSYSCGKDSTLALYRLINNGFIPIALIIAVSNDTNRSWFHGIDNNFIDKISKELGIRVIVAKANTKNYQEAFQDALKQAKQLGASFCAFGDIDIQEHREWSEQTANAVGLDAVFPLWKNNRESIVKEFIDSGFLAIIKTVSKKHGVSSGFLSQTLNNDIVTQFEILGIDVCGENGEYHTFVYDGPIFNNPIKFDAIDIHESNYSYSSILRLKG